MTIFEAIPQVMYDIGYVGKDERNPQQGYKYRGIDSVMNKLNPALLKNHVFVVPEVIEQTREERTTAKGTLLIYSVCKVKYTFFAEDGSYVTATVIGEGMDSGDKSSNKAMSAAYKYACFQTFCIPTEEMIDSETESPEPQPKKETGVTVEQFVALTNEMIRTGVPQKAILDRYGITDLKQMTAAMYSGAMKGLKATKDKVA